MSTEKQYKWLFTDDEEPPKIVVVASEASDRPVRESQADLLDWGDDTERLKEWKEQADV